MVDTQQPSNWLIGIFAKQSNINIDDLANISPQPNIVNQVLRSDIGEKIASLLKIIVKSKDSNISIHQLICDGVESSLADDGKLSLLEVLEKMPGEVVLDVDEFNHFYQAYSKGDIKNFLSIETETKSNLSKRDIFLWHFIDRSHLSRVKKQALLSHMKVNVERLTKAEKTIDLENFVRGLEPKLIQELIEESEILANEFSLASDRTFLMLKALAHQITPDSSLDNEWIFERGFSATVRTIQFSSDGKFLAAGSDDKSLHVWKTYNEGKSYTRRFKLAHEAEVSAIAFSPKEYILASAGEDKSIKLWNLQNGELIRSLPRIQKYGIFSLAFINEDTLACGSWDRSIIDLLRKCKQNMRK